MKTLTQRMVKGTGEITVSFEVDDEVFGMIQQAMEHETDAQRQEAFVFIAQSFGHKMNRLDSAVDNADLNIVFDRTDRNNIKFATV